MSFFIPHEHVWLTCSTCAWAQTRNEQLRNTFLDVKLCCLSSHLCTQEFLASFSWQLGRLHTESRVRGKLLSDQEWTKTVISCCELNMHLRWGSRGYTADTFITPLLPTHRPMPCMGRGRNAGHVLSADWGPLLVHTSPKSWKCCYINLTDLNSSYTTYSVLKMSVQYFLTFSYKDKSSIKSQLKVCMMSQLNALQYCHYRLSAPQVVLIPIAVSEIPPILLKMLVSVSATAGVQDHVIY